MKYADINKRFSEIVTEYLNKGYTFNTATMGGSQGEVAKVDLMVLHFYISNDLFGDLYYAQNGEIEKGDIIVCGKGICNEVQLRMIGSALKLHTVYQTNPITYKKQRIYHQ